MSPSPLPRVRGLTSSSRGDTWSFQDQNMIRIVKPTGTAPVHRDSVAPLPKEKPADTLPIPIAARKPKYLEEAYALMAR